MKPEYIPPLGRVAAGRLESILQAGSVQPAPQSGTEVWVAPGGKDASAGTKDAPLRTLDAARAWVASKQPLAEGGAVVYLEEGIYFPAVAGGSTNYSVAHLTLTAADSGTADAPITYTAAPGADPSRVILSGGYHLDGALFTPTGGQQGQVFSLNLTAAGVDASYFGSLQAGGLGFCASSALMQLYFNGQPMTLARFPNINPHKGPVGLPDSWLQIADGGVTNASLHSSFIMNATSPSTGLTPARLQAWGKAAEGGQMWGHGYWKWGWADSHVRITSFDPDTLNVTSSPDTTPVYWYAAGARWYVQNVLYELDSPGEYYIDQDTSLLYFMPPDPLTTLDGANIVLSAASVSIDLGGAEALASGGPQSVPTRTLAAHVGRTRGGVAPGKHRVEAWSSPEGRTAEGEGFESPLYHHGTTTAEPVQWVRIVNLTIGFTQGVGITGGPSLANVTLAHLNVSNHGGTAAALQGSDITLAFMTASGLGCRAMEMAGGDIPSLTPGNNVVAGCSLTSYALQTRTYNPGIAWAGVGNAYGGNEIGDAPHQGVSGGGNDCLFYGNDLRNLCWEVDDSGAWYTWSGTAAYVHRGSIIAANSFENVTKLENTTLGQPLVHAVYFDNKASNHTTIDNTFVNTFVGVFIGGGRRHRVIGNSFNGGGYHTPVWMLNEETWTPAQCGPNGTFTQALVDVSYMSPPWSTRYPWVVDILEPHEMECTSAYNVLEDNTFTRPVFLSGANSTQFMEWKTVLANNTRVAADGWR